MRQPLLVVLITIIGACNLKAQTLIADTDFSPSGLAQGQYVDLSTTFRWGTFGGPTSCFDYRSVTDRDGFTHSGITMSDSGLKYWDWHIPGHLKNANAVDVRFPRFARRQDTLTIEVDVHWLSLSNGGEDGRVNFILLKDYPANGIPQDQIDSVNALPHPYARPAYHFRIVPRTAAGAAYLGFMSYGGNNDAEGKLYQLVDNQGVARWWMPGAVPVSNPPGGNLGLDYPRSAQVNFRNNFVAQANRWQTITWRIAPEELQVFVRLKSEPASANVLRYQMFIPYDDDTLQTIARLNTRYGTNLTALPYLYRWFGEVDALRLYGVGRLRTTWGGVRVYASGPTALSRQVSPIRWQVVPNPVEGRFQIQGLDPEVPATLTWLSASGKVLAQQELQGDKTEAPADLPAGLYLVQVQQKGIRQMLRVVK